MTTQLLPERGSRQAQFFIITAVLISGALLFITTLFTSTADIEYTDVLSRHDTDIVENIAHRVDEVWWDTQWLYRTTITLEERSGVYLQNQTVQVFVPIKRQEVNNDCSDIRIVDDDGLVPWNDTTGCDVEIYDSGTVAVARYRFDEGYGQWANDSTRQDHHAQLGGSLTLQSADPTWDAGKYEWGLSFDGNDDFADTEPFYSSPPRASYTYWAYFPDTGSGQDEWSRTVQTGHASTTPSTGISHEVNPGGIGDDVVRIVHWTGAGPSVIGDVNVELNRWNHIAHIADGSAARIYVNGEEVLNDTGMRSRGSARVTMGAGDGNNWQGTLDDVRVYNTTLSAGQVKGLYENGIGLNISVDMAPEEEKTYHIYHGNLFANVTEYNSSAFQHRAVPREPEVVNIDPTRSQTEILDNLRYGVDRLDERITSDIDMTTGPDGCAQLRFRSSLSSLRRTIC